MIDRYAMTWSQFNPVRICAGVGNLRQLGELIPQNSRMLLVTTSGFTRRGITERILSMLGRERVAVYDRVSPNPGLDEIESELAYLRSKRTEGIIALGGGSVIDTAKVFSVSLPSALVSPLTDTLRNGALHVWAQRLPVVAIPTTAGTGAEVTPFATVWDRKSGKKHSLNAESLYPDSAILDPELTLSLPPDETLYTALDAISHALESLWNKNKTPISAAYAVQALTMSVKALPVVLAQPEDLQGRSQLQYASVLAGLAISQTRTAIAHSISYPLTSRFGVPHGLACSFTLPEILQANIDTVAAGSHEHSLLSSVLALLRTLDLGKELTRYASVEEVLRLQDEMITKGRADNFTGTLNTGLTELINRSLGLT